MAAPASAEPLPSDSLLATTYAWQAMRQTCYDFEAAYNAQGGNCTVIDLPQEGITGNDHFMFQDLNNVISSHNTFRAGSTPT